MSQGPEGGAGDEDERESHQVFSSLMMPSIIKESVDVNTGLAELRLDSQKGDCVGLCLSTHVPLSAT